MALVTVIEAAILIGKSTQTIYRHAKSGRVSKDDEGKIDTSELIRVYGELKQIDSPRTTQNDKSMSHHESADNSAAWFIKRIEQLETKIEAQRIDFQQRENRFMTLLEHKDDRDNRILELLEHKDNRENTTLEKLEQRGIQLLESLERKMASPTFFSVLQNMIKPKN